MAPTAAQKRAAKLKAEAEAEEAKKATEEAEQAEEEADGLWYEEATPTGEYLPKLEGINYYELLDIGKQVEGKAGTPPRKTQNVVFNAIYHESTTVRGKPLSDSPEEPVEAKLSIPLSAARKLRTEMDEKEIKTEDLVGMILVLQRTGKEIATRYPSVELLSKKEYLE